MSIQLSEHFSYRKLLRFTLPSAVMMIFTSVYSVVDGYFVSNYVGKLPFTAVNFIMPFLMVLGALGFMFGTGGSALVAKMMGEGKQEAANSTFSLIVYICAACSVIIAALGICFLRPVAELLGAKTELLDDCVRYGRIILLTLPALMLQFVFQSFFVVAERPQLGLIMSVAAGVTNIVLDALLVAAFSFGLEGAAWATSLSQLIGGVVPVIYFICPNKSPLRLTRTHWQGRCILRACANGSSELLSNISMSLAGMLYNAQLLKYAGNDGVAAYGVLMYVNFIFLSTFIGYSVGVAPLISFHFGARNHAELRNLLRKSLVIIGILAIGMFALAELLARPLSYLFVGYDAELLGITLRGFLLYSFSFLFAGFAIYGSSFFTALNNGFISALISVLRTLVFECSAVMLLPLLLGLDGIWISIVASELLAACISLLFWIMKRKCYGY